jgi:hypothetical protein
MAAPQPALRPLAEDQHVWAGRVTALGLGLRHASLTRMMQSLKPLMPAW